MTYADHMRNAARSYLLRAINSHESIAAAARAVGVRRTTFYKLMRKTGIPPSRPACGGNPAWRELRA